VRQPFLITPYPHDDDATLFAFYTIIKKYGWSWMDSYMANHPKFIQGHLGTIRSVAAGESVATLDMMVHHTLPRQIGRAADRCGLLGYGSDADLGPAGCNLQGCASSQRRQALPDLVHAEGATKPDRYVVSAEGSGPPFGLKPLFEYNIANDYADIVTNPGLLADLRKRFVGYTGEITNKGGIR
jgi:hypothetical protein